MGRSVEGDNGDEVTLSQMGWDIQLAVTMETQETGWH
jgi:hypothetical protein